MPPTMDKLKFSFHSKKLSYELPENYTIVSLKGRYVLYILHLSIFLCSPFLVMKEKQTLSCIWQLSPTDGTIPALTWCATDPSFRMKSRQLPGGNLDPVWTGMAANCSIFTPDAKLSNSNCERLQNTFIWRSIFNVSTALRLKQCYILVENIKLGLVHICLA
jgi:hypothetical protein